MNDRKPPTDDLPPLEAPTFDAPLPEVSDDQLAKLKTGFDVPEHDDEDGPRPKPNGGGKAADPDDPAQGPPDRPPGDSKPSAADASPALADQKARDDLVEKTKKEPAAPFAVVSDLAALKNSDRAAYETLRDRLKTAGCRVGELGKEIAKAGKPDQTQVNAEIERLARLDAASCAAQKRDAAKMLGMSPPDLDKLVKARWKRLNPRKPSAKPEIELIVGQTERIVNEVQALLIASNRRLYQRGTLIVSTGFIKMKTWDKKDVIVQVIEDRGTPALLEDMEVVAQFVARDKEGDLHPVDPPARVALTLKDRKSRLRFPIITGIVNCPSIEVDGTLLDRPGYDPATGVLFDPLGVKFPRVPDFPTKAMAETALERILRAYKTFSFNSHDDKAVMTSGVLTAVARRGLPFAPMHAFDAPVAGSGKSKLVDIICIIATGRRAGVMSQGDKPEEFTKALGAMLMRGDPLIPIDNCSHALEGDTLNMALTQGFVEIRVLGFSKLVTVQTKAFVTATGNNLIVIGDLTRRTVKARLDPNCERPELSQFDFDPIAYAMENRAQLVTDALTILRAYALVGRSEKPPPPRLQSFELWSDTVRAALLWLGQGDPVVTMESMRKSDTALENMCAVFSAWKREFSDERVSADEVIEKAEAHYFVEIEPLGALGAPLSNSSGSHSKTIREKRFTHPDLRNAMMAVAKRSGQLDATALKYWLRGVKERVITIGDERHSVRVRLTTDGTKHASVTAWKLETLK